jgi:hypothetical protein
MRRTRWIVLAALLLALIVTAVIVLSVTGSSHREAASTSQAGHAQACPASTASDSLPTAPPSDLQWKSMTAVFLPTSKTAGPMRYQGSVWSCYAHNPLGAVMAAYDIPGTLLGSDWQTVMEHEIASGPGQQAFIAASRGQSPPSLQPGEIAQPVGFVVVSYSPQEATIQTLADAGDGEYQADERTVSWAGDDWKLVVNPDGKIGPDPQIVASASGFVLWGGNSNG